MTATTERRLCAMESALEFRAFVRRLEGSVSREWRLPLRRALLAAGWQCGTKACAPCRRVLPAEELAKLCDALGQIVAEFERVGQCPTLKRRSGASEWQRVLRSGGSLGTDN